MSLDVYLLGGINTVVCVCPNCSNSHTNQEREILYSGNITHNLNKMAGAAGLYEYLWRPEECGVKKAGQLVGPLKEGLGLLKSDPEYFKQFNASNGWGTYPNLISFVEHYLEACEKYPNADIEASR